MTISELARRAADLRTTAVPTLPPGPRWPATVQGVALLRFRHRFVPWLHRRYGEVFTVRTPPSGTPLVLFTRPEHAKEIFAGDPAVFHAGEANEILGPLMGQHSLLLLDELDHQRARRLLMPAFHGAALRGYRDLVQEIARAEVARWPVGRPVASLDLMNALTLEVILRVVFGVTDPGRLDALRPAVRRVVGIGPLVLVGESTPVLRTLRPWRRTVAAERTLDRLVRAEVTERRAAPDVRDRGDVLSRLLAVGACDDEPALTDDELRDQLVTLLLAGHETTATGLAWTLHELARHPDVAARARRAADEGDDAFLEAVLKESLRLHPVIPMVVRRLTAPATVGGIRLPAGVDVGPSILLGHAREQSFPDPAAFRPDRFDGAGPAPQTWIPFGGGVRRCLGAGFSLMEGVAVLGEVLRRLDVGAPAGSRGPGGRVGTGGPAAPEPARVRNITSVPARGARVVLTPRG